LTDKIQIILRNPLNHRDQVDYTIVPNDSELAQDWQRALDNLLNSKKVLEKNFCFLGFPGTARTVEYLCDTLNRHIETVNLTGYQIKQRFSPDLVVDSSDLGINHEVMNQLHNHFEILQGTVSNLSTWYINADYKTKYAIRQLNNICHELESLILSQRKAITAPEWIRPSQITTWLEADRYQLRDEHRRGFISNGYDRVLGGVYMHWTQIGKTLFEVFRDEHAPDLTSTTCEAITHLQYYSGEFDIEWGNDVVYGGNRSWHTKEQDQFREWLIQNNQDPCDTQLSLGYLPLAMVDLQSSFGTTDYNEIWNILGTHLDIYQIHTNKQSVTYSRCWADQDYESWQIDMMTPGYNNHIRST
jgi:hypothetical protein